MNGVIVVDKPAGWTSHDVVNRLRRFLQERSVGHLGTLDPLATGVLPVVTGSLTRLAQFYIASEKTYEGIIRFGFATNTYDADGEPLGEVSMAAPGLDTLQQLASKFLGHIEQVPPPFSAKKIKGIPAYKLARREKEVILQPVQVEIKEFAITSVEIDRAHFHARVSSGTYMRSIAHEIGQLLGCGAHLECLRRTSVAEFDISQAHTLEEIETCSVQVFAVRRSEREREAGNTPTPENAPCHFERERVNAIGKNLDVLDPSAANATETRTIESLFIHPRQLLPQLPSVTADEATAARIRSGRPVNLPELSRARQVKVFSGQRDLVAIATRVAGTLFHAKVVFATNQAPI